MGIGSVNKRRVRRFDRLRIAIVPALAMLAIAPAATANDGERVHWKPVERAQLKIDDKPPLTWSVYRPDKKKVTNQVLVLLGKRYIALDTKAKLAYQVFPADLSINGSDVESGDLFKSERVLPSSDWVVRDVGPAERIQLRLKDYGRMIEVMLPHPPDLRAFY
jgi:hypothetical protein